MKNTIDLIPMEVSAQQSTRSELAGWILLGLFLISATILVGVALLFRARSVDAATEPLRAQVAELRLMRDQIQPLDVELRESLVRQEIVQKLLREPAWNELMRDLAAAVSGDVWIQSLQVEQTLVAEEGAPPEPPALVVSGTAASEQELLQFMNAFALSPHLALLSPRQSRQARQEGEEASPRVEFVLEGVMALEGVIR